MAADERPDFLDLWRNSEPVCPYCGHRDEGAWEMTGEDGTTECGECEREYRWTRDVRVTYTTSAMEAGDAPGQ